MMVMEDMLKDFILGEHLLLVGNQVSDIQKSFETYNLLLNYITVPRKVPHWDWVARAFIHRGPIVITVPIQLWCHVKWSELRLQRGVYLLFAAVGLSKVVCTHQPCMSADRRVMKDVTPKPLWLIVGIRNHVALPWGHSMPLVRF